MNVTNFNFSKLEYVDKNWAYKITSLFFGETSLGLFPVTIVRLKNKPLGFGDAPLNILGESIGIEDEKTLNGLKYHQSRLIFHITFVLLTLSLILFGGFFISITIIRGLTQNLLLLSLQHRPTIIIGVFLIALLYLLSFYVIFAIGLRISATMVNRYFADTLCILALFHILYSLSQDDVLYIPWKKRALLQSITFLAKHISLLALSYRGYHEASKKWIKERFDRVISYVISRQCSIVAPINTTLDDLRKDFYKLTLIFITGNYGELGSMDIVEKEKSSDLSPKFPVSILRFVGFILPIVLFSLYLWHPDFFPFISIDKNIITLTLLAWLMLSIDSFFKLGIVASLVDLMKAVKELA